MSCQIGLIGNKENYGVDSPDFRWQTTKYRIKPTTLHLYVHISIYKSNQFFYIVRIVDTWYFFNAAYKVAGNLGVVRRFKIRLIMKPPYMENYMEVSWSRLGLCWHIVHSTGRKYWCVYLCCSLFTWKWHRWCSQLQLCSHPHQP